MVFDKVKVESIRQSIDESLIKKGLFPIVEIVNNFRCIRVSNEDLSLDLWVRLMPFEDSGYSVDFSSVCFPDDARRTGIFTYLVDNLRKNENVKSIAVTSVCTDEMRNWCKKNNFTSINGVDYYFV